MQEVAAAGSLSREELPGLAVLVVEEMQELRTETTQDLPEPPI
jgi:hypothetical protein